jgi:hypothetical protein
MAQEVLSPQNGTVRRCRILPIPTAGKEFSMKRLIWIVTAASLTVPAWAAGVEKGGPRKGAVASDSGQTQTVAKAHKAKHEKKHSKGKQSQTQG